MDLKTAKICILGLGEENIALIQYLFSFGVTDVTICDRKEEKDLLNYLDQIKDLKFKSIFGQDYLDDLNDCDIIFRTPGIAYLTKQLQEAKKHGVIISSQTKLFFEKCLCKIIGVTGTKGKGTTSTLIYEIFKKDGCDVYLGGNIGNAPITFLNKLNENSIVVLELSSFQLQDLGSSPYISVILNISEDHLDIHADRNEYIGAKANIVRYQRKNDFAVINEDYLTSVELASLTPAQTFWFSRRKSVDQGAWVRDKTEICLRINGMDHKVINTQDIVLRGEHNWENISAASLATYLAGVSLENISATIKEFKGLEHRLEFVRDISGVKFYNDSFSTTPDTAIAAIESFTEPIILIAGGSEKYADYTELGKKIADSRVKALIAVGDTGKRIKEAVLLANGQMKIIDCCRNLNEVFEAVATETEYGDVVLLSPASASFDWFVNYKDRGKQFKEKVMSII